MGFKPPPPAQSGSAADITVTPAGSIAATDVQAALVELDTEKAGAFPSPQARRMTAAVLRGEIAVTKCSVNIGAFAAPNAGDFNSRQTFTTGPVGVSDLRLYYAAWFADTSGGDTGVGNTAAITAAIEYDGNSHPVFFEGGKRTITLDDGAFAEGVCSVDIPANTKFKVVTRWVGANYAQNGILGVGSDGDSYGNGGSPDTTGALANGGGGISLAAPIAITGFSYAGTVGKQVVLIGDSISYGLGDSVDNRGFIRLALGSSYLTINLAKSSDFAGNFSARHARRGLLIAGADYAFEQYGVNDVDGGAALATLQGYRVAIWNMAVNRGVRGVFATTTTPKTTSTDAWATVGNQTVAYAAGEETVRVNLNTWLRDGAPLDATTGAAVATGTSSNVLRTKYVSWNGSAFVTTGARDAAHPLAAVFDPALLGESALNSGKWKAGYTGDGAHPNGTGVPALAASIDTSLLP